METPEEFSGMQPAPPAKKSKMLLRVIIFVVAILIVLGVHALLIRNTDSNKTKTTTNVQTAIPDPAEVTITSSGFTPATVEVKVGQSITWTNQDDALHQIAADPHPSHSSLPNLLSDPLSKGESFTFPFEKTGTYTYHDEQNPLKFSATIIVK